MVSKSELASLLADVQQAGASIQSNLERASDLVARFKQVSADQTSEHRRTFDLKEYLRETLVSLHSQWKKRPIEVELEGTEDVILESYPGTMFELVLPKVAPQVGME